MRKARPSGIERLESYLVKMIQEKGADQDQPSGIRALLVLLKWLCMSDMRCMGLGSFADSLWAYR